LKYCAIEAAQLFSFFKKRVRREHAKLVCQSYLAIPYLSGFHFGGDDRVLRENWELIKFGYQYGDILSREQAKSMLDFNMDLRRMYDPHSALMGKSFDEAFSPILGWNSFFNEHKI
jgi:hypothetical protein